MQKLTMERIAELIKIRDALRSLSYKDSKITAQLESIARQLRD